MNKDGFNIRLINMPLMALLPESTNPKTDPFS